MRITLDAMKGLTNLKASKLGIMSLIGLEYATYLKLLVVGGIRLVISPL